jgi:hypothetical protein
MTLAELKALDREQRREAKRQQRRRTDKLDVESAGGEFAAAFEEPEGAMPLGDPEGARIWLAKQKVAKEKARAAREAAEAEEEEEDDDELEFDEEEDEQEELEALSRHRARKVPVGRRGTAVTGENVDAEEEAEFDDEEEFDEEEEEEEGQEEKELATGPKAKK